MQRLAFVVASIALVTSGCGNLVNVEVIGKTGVTIDDAGKPIMLIEVCEHGIDTLVLARTREGLADDEPNVIEGTWQAADPKTGLVEVHLGASTSGWTGPVIAMNSGRGYILEGTSSTADVVTTQVSFTAEQLGSLTPGQVIAGNGTVTARDAFESDSCST